jgi:hypothetical protein
MKTNATIGAGLMALALVPGGPVAAQSPTPWLHVRVEEPGKGSRVHVNLPLNVVEVALKAAPDTIASEGRIHFGREGRGMKVADLRRMWTELKSVGDTDLVTVEEKDENVKVGRKGDLVVVRIERKGKEEVKVEVPVEVVDALLSGDGEELNLKAALEQLRKRRGDIVRVNEESNTVRVWIDEQG